LSITLHRPYGADVMVLETIAQVGAVSGGDATEKLSSFGSLGWLAPTLL
jgi:hypothetical protein